MNPPAWPTVAELAASGEGWLRLSNINLSDQERNDVEQIMTPWMRRHCPQVNAGENKRRIASVSAKSVQLQATQPKQLAVTEMGDWEGDSGSCPCGRNLNCRIWVLSLSGDRATTLLEYSGFGLVVLKSSSHGFSDIVTASIAGVRRIEIRTWRFDGKQYALLRCAVERYSLGRINSDAPIDDIDKTGRISEHPCKPSQ